MRRIFHNEKLPKISKSIFVKEKLLKDPLIQRRTSNSSVDIQHHHLFRKRIVRLKDQKMKYIIERNKSQFFNQDNSISQLSSIKSYKDDKITTFFDIPKFNKKNDTDNIFISKEDSSFKGYKSFYFKKSKPKFKYYYLNEPFKVKINNSKYNYMKNDEVFLKYIINNALANKRSHSNIITNKNTRNLYAIMQNTIITNYLDIPGFYFEIPKISILKTYEAEKRHNLYKNLLEQLTKIFQCKRKIESIFSPNKEIILDLTDIKQEYKFIYVSQTIMCKSISIVISQSFISLYNNEYQEYLSRIKEINFIKEKMLLNKRKKNKLKIRNIIKGIKPEYEKLKPHYSFSAGENDIENYNYFYYSEDEEKKNVINKDIKNYLDNKKFLKNDFFLYLNERETNEKLELLEDNLNYKKTFKLKESYDSFSINFQKLLSRFSQELKKKYGLNPNNFNSPNAPNRNGNYDFSDLDSKFDNLFIKKKGTKKNENKKFVTKNFTNVDKKIDKKYTHLVQYNIPILMDKYNATSRKRFFEIFIQFKDLLSIALALKKNEMILKNGLDFDTFHYCLAEIQNQNSNFAKNLFAFMNKSNSSLLNIEDFMNGMNYIKNSDLSEKVDIYLNSMNILHNGQVNFKDAVKVCTYSILKNLGKEIKNKKNSAVLNELGTFLASYIFELVGCDSNKNISLGKLKKIVDENNNNQNIEYFEMFFGV